MWRVRGYEVIAERLSVRLMGPYSEVVLVRMCVCMSVRNGVIGMNDSRRT